MELTAHLDDTRRAHVEGRLRANLMAWLSTVRPDGRPDTVPVWFLLRDDGTFLVFSQASKTKLRNIEANPNVALALDVTDIGRDVIRVEGTAVHHPDHPAADQVAAYVAKYAERIGTLFGTPADFAALYAAPLVITPRRLYA